MYSAYVMYVRRYKLRRYSVEMHLLKQWDER